MMTERMEHQILTALENGDDFVPKALFAALWGEYREREAECRRLAAKCVDLSRGDSACRCRPTDASIEASYLARDAEPVPESVRAWVTDLLTATLAHRDAVAALERHTTMHEVADPGSGARKEMAVQEAERRLRDVRGW